MMKRDGLEMIVNAASGATGSAAAKCVSYPLDRLRSCLMAKVPEETFMDVLRTMNHTGWYAAEIRLFLSRAHLNTRARTRRYTGLPIKLVKSVVQYFLYFYIYEGVSQMFRYLLLNPPLPDPPPFSTHAPCSLL